MTEAETKDGVVVDGEWVLEWLPSGRAFDIRDKRSLEREVLPRYFRTRCKSTSFVRKLYRQVTQIRSHPCFALFLISSGRRRAHPTSPFFKPKLTTGGDFARSRRRRTGS